MSFQADFTAGQYQSGSLQATVPLNELSGEPQWVNCPNCKETAQTRVKGRGKGMHIFMDLMFWPIPGRRHWFETTHWFCGNCEMKLASRKNGKEVRVLATV